MATAMQTYRYSRIRVRYFEVMVQAVAIGRTVYFPLRSLCKALGISTQMQTNRIRRLEAKDSRWEGALRDDIPVPTRQGSREMVCINRRHVTRWLDSIDPTICKITAKGPLTRFQQELEAAAQRFLFGDTGNDEPVELLESEGRLVPVSGALHIEIPIEPGTVSIVVEFRDGQFRYWTIK